VQPELQAEEELQKEEKKRENGGNKDFNGFETSTQEDHEGSVMSEFNLSPLMTSEKKTELLPSGSFQQTSTPDNNHSARNGERAHDFSGLSPLRNRSSLSTIDEYYKKEDIVNSMGESVDLDAFENLLHDIVSL